MNWIEGILIIGGISLDIYAAMELEGAMLAQVKRKTLVIVSSLVILLQMIFFFGGYFVCYELAKYNVIPNAEEIGYIIAIVILVLLGLRLIVKAIRREFIHEKRRDGHIRVIDYVKIIAQTSFYMIFAGCACGFVNTSVIMMAIIIIIASILVVVGGFYTGYHFGIATRTGTYAIGAVLLWVAGADILVNDVMMLV